MKFNINKEVVRMLELFAKYAVLRRMFYATLLTFLLHRLLEWAALPAAASG